MTTAELLLSDAVVAAAGLRLSKGALFPDAYRTDEGYRDKTNALAKAVLIAALEEMEKQHDNRNGTDNLPVPPGRIWPMERHDDSKERI